MITTSIIAGFIGWILRDAVKWLYREIVADISPTKRLRNTFERIRDFTEFLALSGLVVILPVYMLAMELKEANTETIDFLLPIVMGYMAFAILGLPLLFWVLEKLWNGISRLIYLARS
jgi:DNA integrity scanning protein DisA with diadenylate cyclase activity